MTLHQQTEPNANNVLGNLLRDMMPDSRVLSENTQTFPAHPGRHADVLITTSGRSPVAVEAEYQPAPEAEQDAADRLGLQVSGETRIIESAIALRYPASVRDSYDLPHALAVARLSYCVLYEGDIRFPKSGWLEGSVTDLNRPCPRLVIRSPEGGGPGRRHDCKKASKGPPSSWYELKEICPRAPPAR